MIARSLRHCYIAAALLAGCGGSQPPIGAPGAALAAARELSSGSSYKVSKGLLYVTLTDVRAPYDQVNVYDTKVNDPPVLAAITDGVSEPADACMDREGTLYVTNQGSGAGWVSVYALGSTSPERTITQGIDTPAFCAIDGRGNLWVTNINAPNVVEYPKGSGEPSTTITTGILYPIGIAIDHHGDLYVVNHELYSTSNVVVYPPGQKSPSRTITDGVEWPVGIAVDAKMTLYVTNDLNPANIEEYRAGRSQPYRRLTDEVNGPTAVTFATNGWLYLTNTGEFGGSGPAPAILEYPPGSRNPSGNQISKGLYLPQGSAYYPPLLP